MTKITFYGHACFLLENQGTSLIFDPFLDDNPLSPVTSEDIQTDYILLTHMHVDHLGDTFKLAKAHNPLIISTFEIAKICESRKFRAHSMHLGGKHNFDFGFVRVTPAFHGSGVPGGHACGFIVKFFEHVIYHTGDTCLFGDMKLMGELEDIDLALVPIGDNYTMGIPDAAAAVKLIRPKQVIPMHYNTFPVIECDPMDFKKEVGGKTSAECIILAPGESHNL